MGSYCSDLSVVLALSLFLSWCFEQYYNYFRAVSGSPLPLVCCFLIVHLLCKFFNTERRQKMQMCAVHMPLRAANRNVCHYTVTGCLNSGMVAAESPCLIKEENLTFFCQKRMTICSKLVTFAHRKMVTNFTFYNLRCSRQHVFPNLKRHIFLSFELCCPVHWNCTKKIVLFSWWIFGLVELTCNRRKSQTDWVAQCSSCKYGMYGLKMRRLGLLCTFIQKGLLA